MLSRTVDFPVNLIPQGMMISRFSFCASAPANKALLPAGAGADGFSSSNGVTAVRLEAAGGLSAVSAASIGAGKSKTKTQLKREQRAARKAAVKAARKQRWQRDIATLFMFKLARHMRERYPDAGIARIMGVSPSWLCSLFQKYDLEGLAAVAPYLAEVFPDALDFDIFDLGRPGGIEL
ncbi:MAG: hypothetical protein WCL11_22430 [Verrucomicrobiota bacterium]